MKRQLRLLKILTISISPQTWFRWRSESSQGLEVPVPYHPSPEDPGQSTQGQKGPEGQLPAEADTAQDRRQESIQAEKRRD